MQKTGKIGEKANFCFLFWMFHTLSPLCIARRFTAGFGRPFPFTPGFNPMFSPVIYCRVRWPFPTYPGFNPGKQCIRMRKILIFTLLLYNSEPNPCFSDLLLYSSKPNPRFSGLPLYSSKPNPRFSGLPLYSSKPNPRFSGLPLYNSGQNPCFSGLLLYSSKLYLNYL